MMLNDNERLIKEVILQFLQREEKKSYHQVFLLFFIIFLNVIVKHLMNVLLKNKNFPFPFNVKEKKLFSFFFLPRFILCFSQCNAKKRVVEKKYKKLNIKRRENTENNQMLNTRWINANIYVKTSCKTSFMVCV